MSRILMYDISTRNPENEYLVIRNIGSGTYGDVYKAKRISTNEWVAIKKVKLKSEKAFANIQQEILTMKECCHPNIITFYKSYLQRYELWICMEYCGGGSLQDIYLVTGPLTEKQIAYMCRETLRGLSYLHKKGKMHRDIKGGNILLTKTGDVKIADFGFSTQIATISKRKSFVGTPYWMAPEIVAVDNEGGYNQLCDIWACGITAIELAEPQHSMFNLPQMRALLKWTLNEFKPPTLEDTNKWTPTFHNFVEVALTKDPKERPTAEKLLQHPFFHGSLNKRLAIELLQKKKKILHKPKPIDLESSDDDGEDLEVQVENSADIDITNDQTENDLSKETNNSDTYVNKTINYESRSTKKKYKCDICKKDFKHKNSLRKHLLKHIGHKYNHTNKRPFQCDQCEYSCTQKGHLISHKYIHTDERPFKCDQCEYTCRQKCNLVSHKYIHTDERPFKCDQCEYTCRKKCYLVSHKYIHTDERPFKCDQCEYSCTQKGHLVSHKYIHTDERPFKCDKCEYTCRQKVNLKIHKTKHSIKKPFKCDQCKCTYKYKRTLRRHKLIHSNI